MSTITSRLEYLVSVVIRTRSRSQATIVTTDCEFVITPRFATSVPHHTPTGNRGSVNRSICTTIKCGQPGALKHGVTFSYSSAWRALQCHCQDISKADVISFGQIPYFLH
ncbi:hypothetical protein BASA60_002766 [Batrachochytrium salamandrivorans]|nr:hypothetical protein BASA60_002766 [Batrachochytrium salamandrivorans]